MAWPATPALTKDHVDEDTDSLPLGRGELEDVIDRLNLILAEVTDGATIISTSNNGDYARRAVANTFTQANTFNSTIRFNTTATFNYATVSSGLAIDWRVSNKVLVTSTSNGTLTFTAPPAACNLILLLPNSAGITLPATVQWPGSAHPTLSGFSIVSLVYVNSTYYAVEALDFGTPA